MHGFENRCVCQEWHVSLDLLDIAGAATKANDLLYIVGHDMYTRRKQSEEAHRASEEQFRALVEYAPEAMVVYDADEGQFVSFNS